jgi:phosphate transport system substrate-binding protein
MLICFPIASCKSSSNNQGNGSSQTRTIENKGSDTIVNLALAWAEAYQGDTSGVQISVTGGGSGTGIAALINGTVDIANASRQIKPEERESAENNGIVPTEFVIARDAIAIIVNKENPVDTLTIEQISDIYSGRVNNWLEVGGEDRPIVRLSRETNSGTHVYFLENVLRKGDKEDIRQNPNAIGYDGLGYVTEDLKLVAVADVGSSDYILPSAETVNQLLYPIARDLYMYTAGEPTGDVLEYLSWILGPEAQEIVTELGFVPVGQ